VAIDSGTPTNPTITSPTKTTSLTYILGYTASTSTGGIKRYWVREQGLSFVNNGTSTSYTFGIGSGEKLPTTHTYCVKAQNNSDNNSAEVCITPTFESATGRQRTTMPKPEPTPKGPGQACSTDSECQNNRCIGGKCAECLTDNECLETQQCRENICLEIKGNCGYPKNHVWVKWNCCQNNDCGQGEYCETSLHTCIQEQKPILEITTTPKEPTEGQKITIEITDRQGNQVPEATVQVNEKTMQTDTQGRLQTTLPADRYTITATKEGYRQDGKVLEVKKQMLLQTVEEAQVGELIEVKTTDKEKQSVPNAEITIILENGQTEKMKTNQQGIAYIESRKTGLINITAFAPGYTQAQAKINITQPEQNWATVITAVVAIAAIAGIWLIARKTNLVQKLKRRRH